MSHPAPGVSPVIPSVGAVAPVAASAVRLTAGFWRTRQDLNTTALLDHCDTWIDRMGWYDTFKTAAGIGPDKPLQGKLFTDADVYKLLEAFAWEVAQRPDSVREARIAEIAGLIAAAQEDDGYLNTFFGPRGREARYTDLAHGHELYCAGHLFQAAVARLRGGTEDDLTRAAIRLADRICEDFGEGGLTGSDGHPEVEVGLMELYRATGQTRYLDQARRFVDQRGHQTFEHHAIGHEYYLDDVPVREATVLRGHVVRAMYLTAGAVDLAVESGDAELLAALVTQWENTWARRTYITGGMGSRHLGESFGRDFELPPDRAYTETCGAVAAIQVAWRLLLATGQSHYADAIERLLYNMIATSPNAEGDRFFYVNPLLAREPGIEVAEGEAPFRKDTLRANWFWVSCCPTNVVRLLSSLTGYFATVDDAALTVQQYFTGEVRTRLADGREVGIDVTTDYPWDGQVAVRVAGSPGTWTLRLRIPAWAAGATVEVDGQTTQAEPGYVSLTRAWADGDVVLLNLPVVARLQRPDSRIDALRGTAAVQRGPLVYCAESVVADTGAVDLDTFRLDTTAPLVEAAAQGPSDAAEVVRVRGVLADPEPTRAWPYAEPGTGAVPVPGAGVGAGAAGAAGAAAEIELVPYYAWSNRGPSTMRVWIPVDGG
ncbi:glycoside hydrolase family 127 protein [Cellulomonas sp. KRMCY2]|uniref:glycoside hydrolase family 127 protein n=1 Tax=Cellulomonas sp. KRMCY2 TaxID=1304865 RepID=UPI0004A369F6|nr:beta-L-arabinofuranosidase domain-containing protein [Cellulomonas sp. KRMCY2]